MVVASSDSGESEHEGDAEPDQDDICFQHVSDPDGWMALNRRDGSSSSPNSGPEVDSAGLEVNTRLQYGLYHVHHFMHGCLQQVRHLMARDHSMQGRGYAVPYNLLRILRNYERNGISTGEVDHMTLMHRSISEMESVLLERGGSVLAIQDEGQGRIYQDFADNLSLEPEMEEPSAEEVAERGIRVWQDAKPDAERLGSPESMAMRMILQD